MLDREHRLPLVRQCELLGVARSTFYHRPRAEGAADLDLMRQLDEIHLRLPFLGSRRMVDELDRGGLRVNLKRVRRLMRLMGIRALYPRKRTSQPQPGHRVFPYLLRELKIVRPNQVWASDITYIPMAHGFMYLVAVMDWFSRRVLAWEVSNSLEADFCVEALEEALRLHPHPEIFNTDQGAQFTASAFTGVLASHGVAISMDGRRRWLDNVFIERLWWSVKYEDVYLRAYETPDDLREGLCRYFAYYNGRRRHMALGRQTPDAAYFGSSTVEAA